MSDTETNDQNDSDEGVYHRCNVCRWYTANSFKGIFVNDDMDIDELISGDAHRIF